MAEQKKSQKLKKERLAEWIWWQQDQKAEHSAAPKRRWKEAE